MSHATLVEKPDTMDAAAAALREHASAGRVVRPRGGGTKLGWGARIRTDRALVELDLRDLNRIIEHNAGDFTAVLEAGISLKDAQAVFARAGQMLAIDPPLGASDAATIGGILATNDSGPLRHRYGSIRDLAIGITVALSDGTIATSGGKVIKNVAGYDLAKLFTGSLGTLGVVLRVAVRLHPLAARTATVGAQSQDPDALSAAAIALTRLPLEADCLDLHWSAGRGRLLVRFAGAAAEQRAKAALARFRGLDAAEIIGNDERLWLEQRIRQRNVEGVVLKVAGRPTDLPGIIRAADRAGGSLVSRAALGLSWVALPADADVDALRSALAPRHCTVLDGADRCLNPWPELQPSALTLMQRVKARFDPADALSPGIFVGGI